jgi:hypothetical protein
MVPAKRFRCLQSAFSFSLFLAAVSPAIASNPDVIKASRHDVSLPLSRMVVGASFSGGGSDQTPTARATGAMITSSSSDPIAAPLTGPLTGVSSVLNFDGQSAQDNRDVFGFAFVPPDTNGAVGATQFVQMVNVTIAVYDKSSGALKFGPAAIHTLWTGFGGLCEFGGGTPTFSDGGDPIVLYDHLAGRWLVSQLQYDTTFTHTAQCVAVSTSSDATGSYSRYEFDFGSNFPDYPKFGIWRNFGDHESLVVNHTVKGGALAGVRWYELRNPTSPTVYQQETLVDPDTNFWLGSIAMDKAGNISLGFSASSRSLFPSLYLAGRAQTDPPGTMSGPLVLFNGSGAQFNSFKRWGDYSSMSVDPEDDCTFWYTNEYYATTSSFNWSTRIGAFKFDSCNAHGK